MPHRSPYEVFAAIEFATEFHVTPEHIRLLRHGHSSWTGDDWGGVPGLSPKRPFGNSDVYDDVASIVDGRKGPHDPAQQERYDRLLGECALVLGIALQSGSFAPGLYVREFVGSGHWRLAG